ncbi:hypothetical protein HYS95_01695 [Candidatus Daviesbacteria bacterium]|nr:hypothetical protein [Candidatus Daviesbacteria bacterium]
MSEAVDASGVPQLPPSQLDNPELKEHEGLRMDFRIDNRHLIKHTIACMDNSRFSSEEHREDLVAFQDSARKESERCYDYIAGRVSPEQFAASGGTLEEVTGFLTRIEQGSEFEKIRQQTEIYLASIKTEWERNYPQTSRAVQEMTGVDLNKQITVWITHPNLKNGQYLGIMI